MTKFAFDWEDDKETLGYKCFLRRDHIGKIICIITASEPYHSFINYSDLFDSFENHESLEETKQYVDQKLIDYGFKLLNNKFNIII